MKKKRKFKKLYKNIKKLLKTLNREISNCELIKNKKRQNKLNKIIQ